MVNVGSFLPSGRRIDAAELSGTPTGLADRQKNARPARTINMGLPLDLSPEEQPAVTADFAIWLQEMFGIATTAALHTEHKHNQNGFHVTNSRT